MRRKPVCVKTPRNGHPQPEPGAPQRCSAAARPGPELGGRGGRETPAPPKGSSRNGDLTAAPVLQGESVPHVRDGGKGTGPR